MRQTLPHRRPSITVEVHFENHPIAMTMGFDPALGDVREVFANAASGGQMQATVADACVLVSLLLQMGMPAHQIGKSLARVPDPMRGPDACAPASPIGTIVAGVISGGAA